MVEFSFHMTRENPSSSSSHSSGWVLLFLTPSHPLRHIFGSRPFLAPHLGTVPPGRLCLGSPLSRNKLLGPQSRLSLEHACESRPPPFISHPKQAEGLLEDPPPRSPHARAQESCFRPHPFATASGEKEPPRFPHSSPPHPWESAAVPLPYLGDLLEGKGCVAIAGSPKEIRVGSSCVRRRELSKEAPAPGDRLTRSHGAGSNEDGADEKRGSSGGFPRAVIHERKVRGPRLQTGFCGDPMRTLWGRIRGHPGVPHAPLAPPSVALRRAAGDGGASTHTASESERRGARVPGGAVRLGTRPTNIWNKQPPSRS